MNDTETKTDHRVEIRALRKLCRLLDAMPEGARGRALRWVMSKHRREVSECGLRGEE